MREVHEVGSYLDPCLILVLRAIVDCLCAQKDAPWVQSSLFFAYPVCLQILHSRYPAQYLATQLSAFPLPRPLFSSPLPALVCLAGETIYSSLERRILAWTIGAYSLELLSSTSSSSPDSSDHVLHSPTSFPFCAIVCNRERERGREGRAAAMLRAQQMRMMMMSLIRCLIKNMA